MLEGGTKSHQNLLMECIQSMYIYLFMFFGNLLDVDCWSCGGSWQVRLSECCKIWLLIKCGKYGYWWSYGGSFASKAFQVL